MEIRYYLRSMLNNFNSIFQMLFQGDAIPLRAFPFSLQLNFFTQDSGKNGTFSSGTSKLKDG